MEKIMTQNALIPLLAFAIITGCGERDGSRTETSEIEVKDLIQGQDEDVWMTPEGVFVRGRAYTKGEEDTKKAMIIAKLKAYAEFCNFYKSVDQRKSTVAVEYIGTPSRVVSHEARYNARRACCSPASHISLDLDDALRCSHGFKNISLFQDSNGTVRYESFIRTWHGTSQSSLRRKISLDENNFIQVESELLSRNKKANTSTKKVETCQRYRSVSSGTIPKLREYSCNLEGNKLTRTFFYPMKSAEKLPMLNLNPQRSNNTEP